MGFGPYWGFIRSARRRQSGGQSRYITAVAVIDVVGADDLAHEALKQIVALVAQLGAADATDGAGTVVVLWPLADRRRPPPTPLSRWPASVHRLLRTSGMVSRSSLLTHS